MINAAMCVEIVLQKNPTDVVKIQQPTFFSYPKCAKVSVTRSKSLSQQSHMLVVSFYQEKGKIHFRLHLTRCYHFALSGDSTTDEPWTRGVPCHHPRVITGPNPRHVSPQGSASKYGNARPSPPPLCPAPSFTLVAQPV